MSYNNNIPQPADDLDVSQGDLLVNFQTIDTWGSVDHYTFSNGTANRGKHTTVTTPDQSVIPTTVTDPKLYAHQYTVPSGVLQFSKPPSDGTPTPITNKNSPLTPIVLAPGQNALMMDFTGLTLVIALVYTLDAVLGSKKRLDYLVWANNAFAITNIISPVLPFLSPVVSGNTLLIQNDSATVTASNAFWTIELVRIA